MPQVNELSWISLSIKLMAFYLMVLIFNSYSNLFSISVKSNLETNFFSIV